ncbi:MAG: tetratricopeptide repeat protein [Gammaproteobacteria bacterium]|nr:tetratricopeptide repeat protein [Gammaproteobacteria bacterium]
MNENIAMCLLQRLRLVLSTCLLLLGSASPLHSFSQVSQLDDESAEHPELIDVESESEAIDEFDEFDEKAHEQALLDRDSYEQIINELENNSGQNAYSNELSEAYLNLAATSFSLGDFDKAAETYDQALQIIRISTGLNSLQQLPILQVLLETSVARSDWQAVDTNAHLIFHINRRNFPAGDRRRVEALIQLGTWKIKAASEDMLGGFRDKTEEAADLYSNEIRQLESLDDYEGKDLNLATLYLGEARSNIALAMNILEKPLSDYSTGQQRTTMTQKCRLVRLANGTVTQICETVEVPNMQYYLDPSIRKNQEISMTLATIRRAITNTFDMLKEESPGEQSDQLFIEMQEVTEAYNTFVTKNIQ